MVYLYDMVFVLSFLGFKQFLKYTQDTNINLFQWVRPHGFWFEFSFVMLALYFVPVHTLSESATSFVLSLLTKLIFDIVFPENYRKNKKCDL